MLVERDQREHRGQVERDESCCECFRCGDSQSGLAFIIRECYYI